MLKKRHLLFTRIIRFLGRELIRGRESGHNVAILAHQQRSAADIESRF